MERLTEEKQIGPWASLKDKAEAIPGAFANYDCLMAHMTAVTRLKAYEDTGLTPDEITAMRHTLEEYHRTADPLLSAKAQGRVVVLPCKVGDVVYGFYGEKTILPMVAKWIETNTDGWCIAAQYTPMAPRFYRFSDFGKTVFLTREEAEKALEGIK